VKVTKLELTGLLLIETERFPDHRGFLYERYNRELLKTLQVEFVQQNVSVSKKGVIRGMHWQCKPFEQGKLVTCMSGEIFDVAVDIRTSSPTFGQHISLNLSGANGSSLWIPSGFAHGFQVLTDEAVVTYSVTSDFQPSSASAFHPKDPKVSINWPLDNPILSEKDSTAKSLAELPETELF